MLSARVRTFKPTQISIYKHFLNDSTISSLLMLCAYSISPLSPHLPWGFVNKQYITDNNFPWMTFSGITSTAQLVVASWLIFNHYSVWLNSLIGLSTFLWLDLQQWFEDICSEVQLNVSVLLLGWYPLFLHTSHFLQTVSQAGSVAVVMRCLQCLWGGLRRFTTVGAAATSPAVVTA